MSSELISASIEEEEDKQQLIQSWIMTLAKHGDKGFNTIEKRILYRITEMFQSILKNDMQLRRKYSIDEISKLASDRQLTENSKSNITTTLFGDAIITMPLAAFQLEGHRNQARIKQAFKSMMTKVFEYMSGDEWEAIALIENPKIRRSKTDNRALEVEFKLNKKIAEVLFDFSRGYRKFYLDVAFNLESPYSMRWYELFSQQDKPMQFSIERLRDMFQTGKKYKKTSDFVYNVIQRSKEELDNKSDSSFNYTLLPKERGRTTKVTGVLFVPYRNSKNIPTSEIASTEVKKVSLSWYVNKPVRKYLEENFMFTSNELQNHVKLFKDLKFVLKEGELIDIISSIRYQDKQGQEIKNRKGYIINTLKKIRDQKYSNT